MQNTVRSQVTDRSIWALEISRCPRESFLALRQKKFKHQWNKNFKEKLEISRGKIKEFYRKFLIDEKLDQKNHATIKFQIYMRVLTHLSEEVC